MERATTQASTGSYWGSQFLVRFLRFAQISEFGRERIEFFKQLWIEHAKCGIRITKDIYTTYIILANDTVNSQLE